MTQRAGVAAVTTAAAAPASTKATVNQMVKRLRNLEEENALLRARVVASEANVHNLATLLAAQPAVEQQPPRQQQHQQHQQQQTCRRPTPTSPVPSDKIQLAPVSPCLVPDAEMDAYAAGAAAAAASAVARGERGAERQRITSPRQFYLTLLAMYCSAFAHVMHGPGSKRPILSSADARYEYERFQQVSPTGQFSPTFGSKSSASCFAASAARAHGIASAEAMKCGAAGGDAGMRAAATSQKYERMLRASSHGLLRLVQSRRKVFMDRERDRQAQAAAAAADVRPGKPEYDERRR